jgi:hypothetical protein
MLRVLLFLIPLALTIYAFLDCLGTDERDVRFMQKPLWALVVLIFPVVGAVSWLIGGTARRRARADGTGPAEERGWVAPDDNPEFLQSLGQAAPAGDAAPDAAAPGEDEPDDPADPDPDGATANRDAAEPAPPDEAGPAERAERAGHLDEERLRSWEADLRRREEQLRRRQDGTEDSPPQAS